MTPLSILTLACAALALLHARRRPAHWPVAALLAWAWASDGARWALDVAVLAGPRPYAGLSRFAWYAAQLLEYSWPAALAVGACWVFLRRFAWPIVAVLAFVVLVLCSRYPELSGAALGVVKAKVWAAFVAVGTACAIANRYLVRDAWGPEHVAVGLLLVGESAVVWSMLAAGGAVEPWWPARLAYWLGFGLVAAYEMRQLLKFRRS